jgi:hypothetical protein
MAVERIRRQQREPVTMKDYRYIVKWTAADGATKYGVVETYFSTAKKLAKKGVRLVEDAILPTAYEVPDAALVDVKEFYPNEYDVHVEAELKKAEAKSTRVGPGLKPGKLFTTPVGDGQAFYVVEEVKKTKVKVSWRGFSGDRWVDRYLGYGGWADRRYVEGHVRWQDGWAKLMKQKAS